MGIHPFFEKIMTEYFNEAWKDIFANSLLLQYIEKKTRSIVKSSKSRASYGNLYAIYVLVEDYLNRKSDERGDYSSYGGMKFSDAFKRQRELPFGQKLQNHALNHRCNQEFKKFFPKSSEIPIIRHLDTKRYWINEDLLFVNVNSKKYNIAKAIIGIIDGYVAEKINISSKFLGVCEELKKSFNNDRFINFLKLQITPTADARIFEIVSFVIMKNYYALKGLILYKTGRTTANDGGIDFVMKPKCRFFQVSEVLDFKKYFLDIDKIQRYPITFVIKSLKSHKELGDIISKNAKKEYPDKEVLKKYLDAIEEIISIPILLNMIEDIIRANKTKSLLDDLILYYKTEFNIM